MQHTTPVRFSNGWNARAASLLVIFLAGLHASDVSASAQELAGGNHGPTNRLAKETSPYLLLHAHNPVDWYPWGPEAFARAKAENKPIFLSIGYSSCYWCHVMERESFEDARDREVPERALREHQGRSRGAAGRRSGLHGRPPGVQPRAAGRCRCSCRPTAARFTGKLTFLLATARGSRVFSTVLRGIVKAWNEERGEIERSAAGLTEIVRRKLGSPGSRRKPRALASFAALGPRCAGRTVRPGISAASASTRRTRAGPSSPNPSTWYSC